jgi:hypothetical protein
MRLEATLAGYRPRPAPPALRLAHARLPRQCQRGLRSRGAWLGRIARRVPLSVFLDDFRVQDYWQLVASASRSAEVASAPLSLKGLSASVPAAWLFLGIIQPAPAVRFSDTPG